MYSDPVVFDLDAIGMKILEKAKFKVTFSSGIL